MNPAGPAVVHADLGTGDDRTLCGDAFDAYESEDAEAPIVIASAGEVVTCPSCRSLISYIRRGFTRGYRARATSGWQI